MFSIVISLGSAARQRLCSVLNKWFSDLGTTAKLMEINRKPIDATEFVPCARCP